jgi:hypothetical protein
MCFAQVSALPGHVHAYSPGYVREYADNRTHQSNQRLSGRGAAAQLVAELGDAEGLGECEDAVAGWTGALLECGRELIGVGDEAGFLGPRE